MSTTIAVSPNAVEAAQTRQVAQLALQHAVALQLRGMSAIAGASVSPTPITIEDLNGEPLFHDYALMHGTTVAGTLRTAANRKLGGQVVSIAHEPPAWHPDSALRMATEALHASHPTAHVVASELVCYAYPKIGVKLTFAPAPGAPTSQAIFDASSGAPVPGAGDNELAFASYSLLDRIAPEAPQRIARFQQAEQQLRAVDPEALMKIAPVAKPTAPGINAVSTISNTVKLGIFCPGSPPGCTHYAQITNYFCVDASTQMLLEHYGYSYTQNQIATAMGTTAAQGGTSGSGLVNGFKQLTNNTLLLSFDNAGQSRAQQFADAKSEVDANRPLFTQVPHHYRVCMGYSENVENILFFSLAFDQMLYIYDPWPWNADQCKPGAAYWESWSTSPVMWFGIVHHA